MNEGRSVDPLKEKRESRAMCAHLNVKYAPVDHGNGTASDRWTCVLCGHDFWPKQWLFPAPWAAHSAAPSEREPMEAKRKITELRNSYTDDPHASYSKGVRYGLELALAALSQDKPTVPK